MIRLAGGTVFRREFTSSDHSPTFRHTSPPRIKTLSLHLHLLVHNVNYDLATHLTLLLPRGAPTPSFKFWQNSNIAIIYRRPAIRHPNPRLSSGVAFRRRHVHTKYNFKL